MDSCAVCFKPASLRCSSCSQAGVNLVFCSQEHQKLVWSAHKRVCGSKSNSCFPFIHPPLTQFEADEGKRTLTNSGHPFAELMGGAAFGPVTLWDGLKSAGVRREQVEAVLDTLTLPQAQWRLPPNIVVSAQQVIRTVRYYRVQNSTGKPFFDPFSLLADWDVGFGTAGRMKGKLINEYLEPYYSEMCHRALCFYAAMGKKAAEMGTGPAFQAELKREFLQWKAAMGVIVKRNKPEVLEFVEYGMSSSYDAMRGETFGMSR
ncbi:hypothetical protein JCM6882_008332 [Rhodosporidiobolus microsporus]